jgi:predicted  nucleic acid-binding Zn-ribbon protein
MADFETQIKESQAQVAEAQAKISAITSRIEAARSKLDQGVTLDVENATLEDVHKHTDLMNANIAELIMGLDDVTAGFSAEFAEMRSKTGMESFIGIFSSAKAESMRQERMRSASVDDKLQDLIAKSDVIVKLLQGQLDLLNGQKTRVEGNLAGTLTEREETVGALEAVRAEDRRDGPEDHRAGEQDFRRAGRGGADQAGDGTGDAERASTTRWCRTNR